MDNNKNLMRTREHSNAELRKMFPKDGADIGIIDGKKLGSHVRRYTKHSQLSHHI